MVIILAALGAWMVLWPSIPRIAPPWVQRLVKARMNLGLDIRGGARLSYDVQIGAAIAQRRDRAIESIREQLARDFSFHRGEGRLTEEASQRLAQRVTVRRNDLDNRELTITFANPADASRITRQFLNERGLTERSRSGGTIVAAVKQEEVTAIEESAVQQAMRRIENRIDELAVKETSITARGETIVIEVPGSDRSYFDQIREIISKTARLEFRMCADNATFLERFQPGGELNSRLPEGITLEAEHGVSAGQRPDGSTLTASPLYFSARGPDGLRRLREFIRSIRNEIPDTYDLLIGEDDREARRTRAEVPPDRKVWRTYTVEHIAHVTGDMISSADVQIKPDTNQPYVALSFKTDGARAFAQITTENVRKRFAIVLDDVVMSAPVINEPIRNGAASITLGSGDFRSQMREANELMVVLRAGALPAPLSEGTMDFIGPTLGRDTIRSALMAAGIGMALVMVFMAIWYGSAGMIANAAVVLNLLLQLAAIAFLGATLTLPGFAALALTVGMAVDSNVLINERIKEELRAGKSLRAAVDAGYQHAFTAIFDGHVTTFISGVVLLQYGTGPIKGFAVTLLIGIVANLFTGVFATRVVFDWLVKGLRVKKLSLG
jgi:preprotein translocase subunit SecD